jgi:hypothetical protein
MAQYGAVGSMGFSIGDFGVLNLDGARLSAQGTLVTEGMKATLRRAPLAFNLCHLAFLTNHST